jgi:prolyl oligopeptidase
MRKYIISAALLAIVMTSCMKKQEKIIYPESKKTDQVDTYFGMEIADPYRWLENDTSAETGEWVKAQNEVAFGYLEKIPFRDKIRERLNKIWNYPKYSAPVHEGSNYFMFKNDGMQNQDVLYILRSLDAEPEVFLDPNKLSEDGTVALAGISFSNDGKYLAYSISHSGSDWNEIRFMEVEGRKELDDVLHWVKFSGMAWEKDGIYYSRYDQPAEGTKLSGKNENHKVYYHTVGTPQESDALVYENPGKPMRFYNISVTEDEQHMFLTESESTSGNALYYKPVTDKKGRFRPLLEGFANNHSVIENIDNQTWMLPAAGWCSSIPHNPNNLPGWKCCLKRRRYWSRL